MEWIIFIGAVIIFGSITWWLTNAPKDRYCSICGSELVERVQFRHFNTQTGEKVTQTVLVCPKRDIPADLYWGDYLCLTKPPEGADDE